MGKERDTEAPRSRGRQLEGLPVIRRSVAGIDLGSERHWVCAPTTDRAGREIADFGGTTSELIRMAKWLKERNVDSIAMESTGVYWIAPHEVLEAESFRLCLSQTPIKLINWELSLISRLTFGPVLKALFAFIRD